MNGDVLLSANRKGMFNVRETAVSESQCGRTGQHEYFYNVRIEATDEALVMPHEFVFDNDIIHAYFKDMYHNKDIICRSCERMVLDAIEYFKSFFLGKDAVYKHVKLKRIYMELHGAEISFITGEWKKPE